ncbi:NADH:ubiquinone oxidoreductase 24 [Entomophthora muscae]|uniref:NADH:ubiquinone oxidoreductase 24 n=1 Tax=Entomophthora muscae TaxID=34485 RepID=A0ACC2T287_9FUNG|nr:NADH:ubiquinone oxidoreductase 24 [Entomophthora muscae]
MRTYHFLGCVLLPHRIHAFPINYLFIATQIKTIPTFRLNLPLKNLKEAKETIAKYPKQYKKGAVIPLLHIGQRQLGFTSISVMNEVAKLLEMPPMRVYEVATFYTMFNRDPVGKYFLQWTLFKIISGIKVGETTKDNLFTLVEVECAGACVNAPVLAVNDDYYEDLTPESTKDILNQLKAGKFPTPGPMSGRKAAEPKTGVTSLKGAPSGPGFKVRADL